MKARLILFTFFFIATANAQSWQWGKRGGADNAMSSNIWPEQVRSIVTDSQGNVFVLSPVGVAGLDVDGISKTAYSSTIGNIAPADYMIASFSCNGTYRWSKVIGGYGEDEIVGMDIDALGNIYIAGDLIPASTGQTAIHFDADLTLPVSASSSNTFKQSLTISKYSNFGDLLWVKQP
jgi:hypothetical protein